jgi:4a-hydroxytetrahydrobiopterin dehydratase
MHVQKLSNEEVRARLHELPSWAFQDGKLHREYKFDGFAEAFRFMSTCAVVAQKQDHHPEWFNAFDRVVVDLTTDDAGGVSALDFELAAEMERAAHADGGSPGSADITVETTALEGEGSYTGTRAYDAGVARSIASGQTDALAQAARAALDGPEGASLRAAEQVGKAGKPGHSANGK